MALSFSKMMLINIDIDPVIFIEFSIIPASKLKNYILLY